MKCRKCLFSIARSHWGSAATPIEPASTLNCFRQVLDKGFAMRRHCRVMYPMELWGSVALRDMEQVN